MPYVNARDCDCGWCDTVPSMRKQLIHLIEENAALKQQIRALKASPHVRQGNQHTES